jgi:NAD-dependent dihydropyrimidine dehydrogenase PreA subunit
MGNGRGFRGRGRGMGRMKGRGGSARWQGGNQAAVSWCISLLPAIWDAFNDARVSWKTNRAPSSSENPVPAAIRNISNPIDVEYENAGIENKRVNGKATMRKAPVDVDQDRCTGCGMCSAECPKGAITVGDIAVVDGVLCAGCGVCVEACPVGALSMGNGR